MASKADRYITESGRTVKYDKEAFTDDLMTAGLFLAWAEDCDAEFGGQTAKDAMRAVCRMLDINPRGLRKAIMVE